MIYYLNFFFYKRKKIKSFKILIDNSAIAFNILVIYQKIIYIIFIYQSIKKLNIYI